MDNPKLMQPQEIEVLYILPAVRKLMAKHLKEHGESQNHIAELLHVKKSTISHYINDKRANDLKFDENITLEIKKAADEIKKGENMIKHTQIVLKLIRSEKILCQINDDCNCISKECKENPECV